MKVEYQNQGDIGLITLNHPPVNGLGSEVRAGIARYHQEAVADQNIKAIVIASSGKIFCGGADISEFGSDKALADPDLPTLCNQLEESPKPIIAAINGMALGGGFELAMVCDYRIASSSAAMGLPEVNLGILPGAGGTQRLPRLINVADALDMILSGKPRSAEAMHKLGAVDQIDNSTADKFLQAAIDYARQLLAKNAPVRSCATMDVNKKGIDAKFFADVRKAIAARTRGFYSPEQCIRAVEFACQQPLAKGLEFERECFAKCQNTPQARGQQHIFFAQRQSAKVADINPKETPPRPIKSVAIIGSGTMGGGIAMNFANAGIPTTIIDINQEALDRGMQIITKNYERSAKKGRISEAQMQTCLGHIKVDTDYGALKDADLVIEAALEEMSIKKQVFAKLDEHCKAGAILATNTSTLDIDEIAAATKRPRDVLGMHFFSPANVMRLLEIVRTKKTAPDALSTALGIAKTIKKTPVVSAMSWAFIGNRMLEPYGREACRLILEGATAAQIDKVMYEFGMPMGLPSMIDLAGIDIGHLIRKGKSDYFYRDDPSYAAIADALYEKNRYGQKTGRGFYIYRDREKHEDPEVNQMAEQLAEKHGVARRAISDEEILERSIYALINEGAKVLEEKVAARASDIDVVYCFGYGFPVYRGGPMRYANEIGTKKVLEGLSRYQKSLGAYGQKWLTPAKLLVELGNKNANF